ncbi:MAG: flagellar hook-associated protein FlgL [Planctomycetes bacterium]|nr:flagellar hook-associated protein FlgL [Planctomycetota bacterium]
MAGSIQNTHRNVSYGLAVHSRDLARLQEQVTTGSRVNRISDDPSVAFQLLSLESQKQSLIHYQDGLTDIVNTMEMATTILESITAELRSTNLLLTQISGGIHGQSNRDRIAAAIDDHLEQTLLLANTQQVNRYLFSGAKTSTQPFVATRDNNHEITAVTYQGSQEQRRVEVAAGTKTEVYWVGNDVFRGSHRKTAEFVLDNTGATLGSGTSGVRGDVWLEVTANGASYDLSIDGGATKISVAAAGDITNIPVTNANGEVLYVNASSITTTGTDVISFPGSYDMFETLISIRDILRNERGLPDHQLTEVLQGAIDWTGELSELLLQTQVRVGSRTGYLENLNLTLDDMEFNIVEAQTQLGDADIAQLAIDLARRSVLYEMSLNVAGKLLSISLLDFLR